MQNKKMMQKLSILSFMLLQTSVGFANDNNTNIGLYNLSQFKQTTGKCTDCSVIKQDLWYFQNELISVPRNQSQIAKFSGLNAQEDVKNFYTENKKQPDNSLPPLIWTGSPDIVEGLLTQNASTLTTKNGQKFAFKPVDKIATNLSYYNDTSQQFFDNKDVVVKGVMKNGSFIARTIWLKQFDLKDNLPVQPLNNKKISELVRNENTDKNNITTQMLWTKTGKPVSLANKPVLAFILNGAQGDDDEAHGGHFAVATGVFGEQGQWNNWLVNNFYGLNSFSEKGITASILPMDSYQADLNSGQSWYRPSYMLVAVLKDKKVPLVYQESINRVFNHFYRHDFEYNHALSNCAGINIQTFRSLGWNIPKEGSDNTLKAVAALPFITIKDKSLTNGKKAFDYLYAEKTELYPMVAFDTIGQDLLTRIVNKQNPRSEFEKQFMEDLEAIIYVKIPQFPSSRVMGKAPIDSLDEYMKRVPEDKANWKIVPVGPRVFPNELKDHKNKDTLLVADYVVIAYGLLLLGILYLFVKLIKTLKRKK